MKATKLKYLTDKNGKEPFFSDLKEKGRIVTEPLHCHTAGLMQTSTGYGSKLATPYKINDCNRLKRIYAICYSNASSLYIFRKDKRVFIHS